MLQNRSGTRPESPAAVPEERMPSYIRDALRAVPLLAQAQSKCAHAFLFASAPAHADARPSLLASTGAPPNGVGDLATAVVSVSDPFVGAPEDLATAPDLDCAVAVYPIVASSTTLSPAGESHILGWLALLDKPAQDKPVPDETSRNETSRDETSRDETSPDETFLNDTSSWPERAEEAASLAVLAAPALKQWREERKSVSPTEDAGHHPSGAAKTSPSESDQDASHWTDMPSRSVLASIFEASPFLFCIFDAEGHLLDVNAEVERLSGYRRDDLPETRSFAESVVPDTEERERAVDFIRKAPSGWMSINVSTADGRTVATRWACTELPGDRRLAVGFDDSENETYQQALRTERDRLAMLFQSLPTPVVHGIPDDEQLIVRHVNPAFESVFGVKASEIEGEDLHDWIVPAGKEQEAATINRQVARGTPIHREVRRKAADGERDFRVHAAIRSCGQEGATEAYAIYTDISEYKAYERKLRRAKERAEDAARLKSAMLANMSHEVRTPLTAIIGFSEILANELDADNARFAENIRRSSHRLMNTLDSVLELSKLDAGAYLLRRTKVDIAKRVRDTVEMMHPMAENAGVSLSLLSAPEQPLVGSLDAGAVDRIVTNLVSNALKFTPEGGDVRVRVARDDTGDWPAGVVEIDDTGVGIKSEFLPNLFDAFRQESDGMSRTHEGAGLGLAITRRLTELLGGVISVESEKGRGTCFTVRFPLQATDPIRPPGQNQPPSQDRSQGQD